MKTLAFVIWVMLWPILNQVALAYSKSCGIEYSDTNRGLVALIDIAIWVWIAILLWNHAKGE